MAKIEKKREEKLITRNRIFLPQPQSNGSSARYPRAVMEGIRAL
jgi:hypothetical protein